MAYDFSMSYVGPYHITRGHDLYGYIYGDSESVAPGETVYVTFSGISGFTLSVMSGSNAFFWELSNTNNSIPVYPVIRPAIDTPLGIHNVIFTGISSSGIIHTGIIPVIVEEIPAALSTPSFGIKKPISPIALGLWESGMTRQAGTCSSAVDGNLTWGDMVNILAPSNEDGTWYYDGIKAFHKIAEYTNDVSWYDKADNVRTGYIAFITGNHSPPGRQVFTEGLVMDAARRDPASQEYADDLAAIGWLAAGDNNNPQGTLLQIDTRSMREVSYALEANLDAITVGVTPFNRWTEYYDNLIGQLYEWTSGNIVVTTSGDISYPGYFIQPFIGGLASSALIRYYNYTISTGGADTRIPIVIKSFGDWLIGSGEAQPEKIDIEIDSVLHEYDPTWGFKKYAMRSVTSPFTASDVGKSIHITSGTNWTTGYWTISNSPDASGWVMFRDWRGPQYTDTIPPAITGAQSGVGHIEEWNAWSPASNSWAYKVHYLTNIVARDNLDTNLGGFECVGGLSVPLTCLIIPTLAWLYKTYGEESGSQYRVFVDNVFNASFATGRCPWTGKEFSQQYRNSFEFVDYRNNNWPNVSWNWQGPLTVSFGV